MDTEPTYLCDAELDDETIGKALCSPLHSGARRTSDRRQAYHSHESLLPAQSLSVCDARTERPVHELSSPGSRSREKPRRDSENEQIRILLERQKEQILAVFRAEIHKHEFQADSDRRSIQELNGIIESQRREIDHTNVSDEQLRRDQLLLQEQLSEKIGIFVKLISMKRVQQLRVDESSRRRLIENQDTINELTARIQELQNEVNCMSESRDFIDAESVRSGLSHVPSQPALLPRYRDPGGMLSHLG